MRLCPPPLPPLSLFLSRSFTHSLTFPEKAESRGARKSWGGSTTWSTDLVPPPLSWNIVCTGTRRHVIYTVRIPLAIVCALHVAFFPFLSRLPSKIMQHATAVRLHTSRSTITRFARTYRSPGMDCAALRNYLSSGLVRIRFLLWWRVLCYSTNCRYARCAILCGDGGVPIASSVYV